MANIGPEEEARMRAMGADPEMMKKAASMMKSNPMMRKAAQMMMKNMSPDQMLKVSATISCCYAVTCTYNKYSQQYVVNSG